jgi:hypothetical protein
VVVYVIFSFVVIYVGKPTKMKRFFARSRFSHLLLSFLFVFVGPAKRCGLENFGTPWHAVATGFQTF